MVLVASGRKLFEFILTMIVVVAIVIVAERLYNCGGIEVDVSDSDVGGGGGEE